MKICSKNSSFTVKGNRATLSDMTCSKTAPVAWQRLGKLLKWNVWGRLNKIAGFFSFTFWWFLRYCVRIIRSIYSSILLLEKCFLFRLYLWVANVITATVFINVSFIYFTLWYYYFFSIYFIRDHSAWLVDLTHRH